MSRVVAKVLGDDLFYLYTYFLKKKKKFVFFFQKKYDRFIHNKFHKICTKLVKKVSHIIKKE